MTLPNFNSIPQDNFDRDEFRNLFDEKDLDTDEQIGKLRECVEKRERETLLEKIAIGTYLTGNAAALDIRDDMIGLPPALAEFVIGHIIVVDDIDDQNPSYKMLAKTATGVAEAYQFSRMLEENPEEWTDEEEYQYQAETALILREVAAGRHYFWDLPIEAAKRAYRPHDEIMKKHLGFTIDEAIFFMRFVEMTVNKALQKAMEPVSDANIDLYSDTDSLDGLLKFIEDEGRPPRLSELPDHDEDVRRIEQIHEIMGDRTDYLWIPESVFIDYLPEDKEKERFLSFLDRFSVELGDWDHSLGPDFWSIDDLNPLHIHPYVRSDDEILIPHVDVPRRALMSTFYYDLIQIESYEGEFGNKWGEYIEEWANDSLQSLFGKENVFLSPEYETSSGVSNEFTDILITTEESLILFECKAAKLNIDTRSGDYQALERDLKDGVGKAAHQLNDSLSMLQSRNEEFEIIGENKSDIINTELNYNLIPIVVLGEQYDAVSTNFYDIATDDVSFTPYVVNVMNLDIICEALNSQDDFEEYVTGRIDQVRNNEFLSVDELDYLGLFIENGVGFPDLPDQHIQLRDYSHQVRRAIDDKYGR